MEVSLNLFINELLKQFKNWTPVDGGGGPGLEHIFKGTNKEYTCTVYVYNTHIKIYIEVKDKPAAFYNVDGGAINLEPILQTIVDVTKA